MQFTEEQRAVLDSFATNRLTVVRAVPGSGKTTVFVEALQRALAGWTSPRQGIAALSFTNVAHEIVSKRLGYELPDPHFIGTIDGFLWRFIVRPFGFLLPNLPPEGPRLIPAPIAEHASWSEVPCGPDRTDRADLSAIDLRWNRAAQGFDVWRRKTVYSKARRLDGWYKTNAIEKKHESWKRTGRLTHSDVHAVALELMHAEEIGPKIRRIIASRIPTLLIDEYQDTGSAQAAVFELLLRDGAIHALIVGDPDQAIYGFGGADRHAFNAVEALSNCSRKHISKTQRFGPVLASVAKHVSRSDAHIHADHSAEATQARLVVHDQQKPDIASILAAIGGVTGTKTGILARRRLTVSRLRGVGNDAEIPFNSGQCAALAHGCHHLLDGDTQAAVRIWEQCCGTLLFQDDVDDAFLVERKVDRTAWRVAVMLALRSLAPAKSGEIWTAWVERCRVEIEAIAAKLALTLPRSLKVALPAPRDNRGSDIRDVGGRAVAPADGPEFLTVHGAKGREFDTVIYYCEKPDRRYAPCPGDAWWSDDEEEMETAFVALTRARKRIVLCIHEKTFVRFRAVRPDLLRLFGAPISLVSHTPRRRRTRAV